jgi:hypothetical protein
MCVNRLLHVTKISRYGTIVSCVWAQTHNINRIHLSPCLAKLSFEDMENK